MIEATEVLRNRISDVGRAWNVLLLGRTELSETIRGYISEHDHDPEGRRQLFDLSDAIRKASEATWEL